MGRFSRIDHRYIGFLLTYEESKVLEKLVRLGKKYDPRYTRSDVIRQALGAHSPGSRFRPLEVASVVDEEGKCPTCGGRFRPPAPIPFEIRKPEPQPEVDGEMFGDFGREWTVPPAPKRPRKRNRPKARPAPVARLEFPVPAVIPGLEETRISPSEHRAFVEVLTSIGDDPFADLQQTQAEPYEGPEQHAHEQEVEPVIVKTEAEMMDGPCPKCGQALGRHKFEQGGCALICPGASEYMLAAGPENDAAPPPAETVDAAACDAQIAKLDAVINLAEPTRDPVHEAAVAEEVAAVIKEAAEPTPFDSEAALRKYTTLLDDRPVTTEDNPADNLFTTAASITATSKMLLLDDRPIVGDEPLNPFVPPAPLVAENWPPASKAVEAARAQPGGPPLTLLDEDEDVEDEGAAERLPAGAHEHPGPAPAATVDARPVARSPVDHVPATSPGIGGPDLVGERAGGNKETRWSVVALPIDGSPPHWFYPTEFLFPPTTKEAALKEAWRVHAEATSEDCDYDVAVFHSQDLPPEEP